MPESDDTNSESGRISRDELGDRCGLNPSEIENLVDELGAVLPEGDGHFSSSDVARLSALKKLSDQGHDVSEFVALELDELKACLGAADVSNGADAAGCRVVIVGESAGMSLGIDAG